MSMANASATPGGEESSATNHSVPGTTVPMPVSARRENVTAFPVLPDPTAVTCAILARGVVTAAKSANVSMTHFASQLAESAPARGDTKARSAPKYAWEALTARLANTVAHLVKCPAHQRAEV